MRWFQSTHPRGVRLLRNGARCAGACGFQSTHPRGVRLRGADKPAAPQLVSIHAPAWGATSASATGSVEVAQFQSTHPRGVRPTCHRAWPNTGAGFNPRTRVGCDKMNDVQEAIAFDVSIHAPAWGATREQPVMRQREFSFNPRTRVGCDKSPMLFKTLESGFNPRTRVGCDLCWGCLIRHGALCFNPRTRVGCDAATSRTRLICNVSIHAPAWGATVLVRKRRIRDYVSIHAPAWGAT